MRRSTRAGTPQVFPRVLPMPAGRGSPASTWMRFVLPSTRRAPASRPCGPPVETPMQLRLPMSVLQVASRFRPGLARFGATRPREMRVALTFDDGPHAEWTPVILDVLQRENVPATFFFQGEQVRAL